MISDFADMPRRATMNSAGYDIFAPNDITLKPANFFMRLIGKKRVYRINTGVRIENGDCRAFEFMMILPRSSYGSKYGLRFSNTVPIIDADYRDDIILFVEVGKKLELKRGQKFAQMIKTSFCTFPQEILPTEERKGGIGSTGA